MVRVFSFVVVFSVILMHANANCTGGRSSELENRRNKSCGIVRPLGSGAPRAADNAVGMSMIGWGLGLAVAIAVIAAVIHQAKVTHAHSITPAPAPIPPPSGGSATSSTQTTPP